jgi:hypothetical protein
MELTKEKMMEMLAYEAFIRRAAELDMPFMLKGSYVTRQYFQNPKDRWPNDLDWVYLNRLQSSTDAESVFFEWVVPITEMFEMDGVQFRSFKENAFWRMIDYAMADDFPTVNTDLNCWIDGEQWNDFHLDISFNLDIDVPPVPLLYTPLRGKPFTIPYTVPLALQVSWKLHQTLVRPRFKDLFDLIHLLQHPSFTGETLQQTIQALVKECNADGVDPRKIRYLLSGEIIKLFPLNTMNDDWRQWRFGYTEYGIIYDSAKKITDAEKLPAELPVFLQQLYEALANAGFSMDLIKGLASPDPQSKSEPEKTTPSPVASKIIGQPPMTTKRKTILDILKKLFS